MTDDPLDTRRHFSASSSSSSAAIWETALEDLQPFPNPDVAIKNALKYLSNAEDWYVCDGKPFYCKALGEWGTSNTWKFIGNRIYN